MLASLVLLSAIVGKDLNEPSRLSYFQECNPYCWSYIVEKDFDPFGNFKVE